jgi:3-phenylpropionate/trans-cinnamate dioxygenase ferredoxin reductase subunit
MMADGHVVIVGGGQAGGEAGSRLREAGFAGAISLYGDEPHAPYTRPPLSKAFLAGEADEAALLTRAPHTYANAGIDFHAGVRVTGIDRLARTIQIGSSKAQSYDKLILATGGRPRKLQVPGAELRNIFYLRSIADAQMLRAAMQPGQNLVITGGGYIGLEVAAVAIKLGLRVTVLETAPRLLARVTSPDMSDFYTGIHRAHGVQIRTSVTVTGFQADGSGEAVAKVLVGDGTPIPADLVLIGIGLVPNVELASGAGLLLDNGIVVNAEAQTSDPDIYAIGDCAAHARHGFLQRPVRLESVPNALEQARFAAASICGKPASAAAPPWFWSDQYGLKLQMAGLPEGYETSVLRGTYDSMSFIKFYLKNDVVIAADAINRAGDFMIAKHLIATRAPVLVERLDDETLPLKSILASK